MLLRRFSQHLKAQNWLAVFLDLIIVVSGIFIALQVTNYSKELEEKAVLKEKLATLLVEGQEIIKNTEAYPEQVELFPLRIHQTSDPASYLISMSNLKTAVIVNNTDVMLDMAYNSLGIGHLMDAMLDEQLASGELIPILKDQWCDIPDIYMYYAPDSKKSLRIRCFLDFINERLEKQPLQS